MTEIEFWQQVDLVLFDIIYADNGLFDWFTENGTQKIEEYENA